MFSKRFVVSLQVFAASFFCKVAAIFDLSFQFHRGFCNYLELEVCMAVGQAYREWLLAGKACILEYCP